MANTPYYVKAETDALIKQVKRQFGIGIVGTVTPNVGGIPQINGSDITENGFYFIGEDGDYGTVTSVSVTDQIPILEVTNIERTAVYSVNEYPITIVKDSTPTEGSTNVVESGGAKTYIDGKLKNTFDATDEVNTSTMKATADFLAPIRDYRNFYFTTDGEFTLNESNVFSNSGTIYIFNKVKSRYLRIQDLSQDLSTLDANEWYTFYLKSIDVENFLKGTDAIYTVLNSDILRKKWNEVGISDIKDNDSIVLFNYNTVTNKIDSPFFNDQEINKKQDVSLVDINSTDHKITKSGNDLIYSWKGGIRLINRSTGNRDYIIGSDASTYSITVTTGSSTQSIVKINGNIKSNDNNLPIEVIGIYEEISVTDIILLSAYTNKPTGLLADFFASLGITPTFNLTNYRKRTYKQLPQSFFEKLPVFSQKYLFNSSLTADSSTIIAGLGDSLFARHNHTSINNVVPDSNPPILITDTILNKIYNGVQGQKPVYSRYDKSGVFIEVGTFSTISSDASWDDNGDRSVLTRMSTTSSASVQFTTNSPYFNLLDRIDENGSNAITISVTGGNGRVEFQYKGDVSWVEANGAIISQNKADYGGVDASAGFGNIRKDRELRFRKVGAGIGVNDTIKLTKPNDATRIMYWGLEEIENNKPYKKVVNSARGGHRLEQLFYYVEDDVYSLKPDLVILEIPLLNMIAWDSTIEDNINQVHDYVWGDRSGNLKSISLKNASNDWADFNVVLVIPHHSKEHFNSDGTWKVFPSGYTAQEIYKAVKGFILSRGDLPYIDISVQMLKEIDNNALFSNRYDALDGSGVSGDSYTDNGVHQNNTGTKTWELELKGIVN